MTAVWMVATNTIRETIRQRLFLNIFVFGVGMVVFAMVVGNITFGFPDRVVRSIGLTGVSLAANLMALLVGVGLVHGEIDRKTLFVVLTRPVSRTQYVVGRYLGLVVALAGVVAGFSVVFLLMLAYVLATPTGLDLVALVMAFLEASVLAAFAVVLSSFSTPSLAAGIGLGFWLAAASTDDLVGLTADADGPTKALAQAISYVLPSFARFNYREVAVYGIGIEPSVVIQTILYGGLYAAAFVALASVILSRREMT